MIFFGFFLLIYQAYQSSLSIKPINQAPIKPPKSRHQANQAKLNTMKTSIKPSIEPQLD
jgi:hypothetical protein